MPSEKLYTPAFFDSIRDPARTSAEEIVPLALQMLAPHSVIDVGCATGEWLAVFREMGINDIAGVDGHYLDPSQLRIPREVFHPVDLAQPFSLFRQFDLVLCLEVGEHLPEGSAAGLVASLVRLGPAIFSPPPSHIRPVSGTLTNSGLDIGQSCSCVMDSSPSIRFGGAFGRTPRWRLGIPRTCCFTRNRNLFGRTQN
jgi:SAM-dependent methyltransferase